MRKFWQFFRTEFSRKPSDSCLQMFIGGLIGFFGAFFAGPHFGCGPGNTDIGNGAMTCLVGEMPIEVKASILACVVAASFSWGRAMSLIEHRILREK